MKIPNIPSINAYSANEQRQPNQANDVNTEKQQQPSQTEQKVIETVEQLNSLASQSQHFLKFNYHKDAEEYYVQVIDSKTDEVIREIPSKEILDYFSDMKKFIGLLFDQSI